MIKNYEINIEELDLMLGSFVGEQRRQKGLTQNELSHISGVSRNTIARLETGWVGASFNTAFKLITALGLELEDFSKYLKTISLKDDFVQNVRTVVASELGCKENYYFAGSNKKAPINVLGQIHKWSKEVSHS